MGGKSGNVEMSCKRCGKCCQKVAICLDESDINREPRLCDRLITYRQVDNPKTLGYMIKTRKFYAINMINRVCPFLVRANGQTECLIYETRPQMCRDFVCKKGLASL